MIARLIWVLAPGAAHLQSSAHFQPPLISIYIKLHVQLYGLQKKSMNPLLRLDVDQVVQQVACDPLGIADRIFLYSKQILYFQTFGLSKVHARVCTKRP